LLEDYFILLDVREQNRRLKSDNDKLRMENVYFRNQLATAQNAKALTLFQAQIPSRTVAARVIGNSTVVTAKAVFIDRGSTSGIENGMAVVTPDGIVGKVSAVYPLVAQVLLVTDPTFKVGIESQKGHIHGVLDCGSGKCTVQQVQNEDKIGAGEWFFTSGEDRIFPRGFPVGTVVSAQDGQGMKDVKLNLSGDPGGSEEVLVVLQGVHQNIPTTPVITQTADQMLPSPIPESSNESQSAKPQTEADKIIEKYSEIGKQQNHVYGGYGSNLPNFNEKVNTQTAAVAGANGGKQTSASPPAQTAPPKPATPVIPSLLGARPGAAPPVVTPKPQPAPKPAESGPALPLGAPRHKPATSDTSQHDERSKQ